MLRAKWFADGVFPAKPFAKINQLAAVGAEGAVFACEPVASPLASRAFDVAHALICSRGNGIEISYDAFAGFRRCACSQQDFLYVIQNRLLLSRGQMRTIKQRMDVWGQFGGLSRKFLPVTKDAFQLSSQLFYKRRRWFNSLGGS